MNKLRVEFDQLILIGWVGPKVNGLDLGSGLGPNRLGWA